jgi:hypothetical protein
MRSTRLLAVAVLAVVLVACSFRSVLAPPAQMISVMEVTTNNDVTTEFHFLVSSNLIEFTLTGGSQPWNLDTLDPGIYTIRQTVPSGWALKDISCQYGSIGAVVAGGGVFAVGSLGVASYVPKNGVPWTVDLADHSVTINLAEGDYPLCTFTNSPAVGAPVGGFVEPINQLAVVGPYLALAGLIAAAAVAAVAIKKRHKN